MQSEPDHLSGWGLGAPLVTRLAFISQQARWQIWRNALFQQLDFQVYLLLVLRFLLFHMLTLRCGLTREMIVRRS